MLSAYTVTKTMGSYDRCGASTNEPATFDAVFDSGSWQRRYTELRVKWPVVIVTMRNQSYG